jgi:hypothetical protein
MDMMDKKGQMIMIRLLLFFMTIAVLIALIPAFNVMLNTAQQSDGLNCKGYSYYGEVNNSLSYNSSLGTNILACMAIDLYLPYIILCVLIGGVSWLVTQKNDSNVGYVGY